MKKLLAVLVCGVALTACSNEIPMSNTWQVTNVYTSPDVPSQVPVPAYLVFGDSTVTGSTGCAEIQGRVSFTPDAAQPTHASFRDMNFRDASCEGSQRFFHDQMVALLGGELEVKKEKDEMLLTKTDGLDRPGIRLVAAN